jgi:hypothetical protein
LSYAHGDFTYPHAISDAKKMRVSPKKVNLKPRLSSTAEAVVAWDQAAVCEVHEAVG